MAGLSAHDLLTVVHGIVEHEIVTMACRSALLGKSESGKSYLPRCTREMKGTPGQT